MRIAIVGSGGVGGYFGGRLAAAGSDVRFLARGAHLAAMRERGLHIDSPNGNIDVPQATASDDPAAIGPVDVVLFTVKLYDATGALPLLPPLLHEHTVVVPLQNGVESVDRLSGVVGPERVAGGTTYVVSALAAPGVIRHTALGRLIFGPLQPAQRPVLEQLLGDCRAAAIDATLSDQVTSDIWAKFVRLTAFSGMTAVTRSPIGVLRDDPALWALTRRAVEESMAVAQARGIPLPSSLAADIPEALRTMPPQSKSSMLEDLERGKPLELPWLSGAITRIGQSLGVDTPTHAFITAVLSPWAGGATARNK